MKRLRRAWLPLLGALLALAALGPVPDARGRELLVGMDQQPPYEYVQSRVAAGPCTQVLAAVLERMGERAAPPARHPWKRGLDLLARGQLDILYSGVRDEGLAEFVRYGTEPLVESRWVALARAGEAPEPFTGLDTLAGHKVGLVLDQTYSPQIDAWARANPLVERVVSYEILLSMLRRGRVDYVLGDALAMRHLARTQGREREYVELSAPPLEAFGLYPLFSRARLDQDFVNRFDAALREFKAGTRYREILDSLPH
ncbi:substrate-binding periplasmic protein [Desulfocurvus vexinensis]|uniref:substrate-binding periplasmic protein n=1 Tax=Desulfocurvus vexinensis TaxID=399548 RepID=UPI000A05C366|nr:transporter substrate-binding domain-containing protein [Desulfocurvus vexinensis]